jgi:hypothetical protein
MMKLKSLKIFKLEVSWRISSKKKFQMEFFYGKSVKIFIEIFKIKFKGISKKLSIKNRLQISIKFNDLWHLNFEKNRWKITRMFGEIY